MSPGMARKLTFRKDVLPTRDVYPISVHGDVTAASFGTRSTLSHPLHVHSLAVTTVAFLMLHMVYGHSFLLDSSANYESFNHPYLMLYHSDITTLVSFALVLVRLLAAAWFALNHLLTVSGVLLAIWQSTCAGKTVRRVVLAALMLDTKSHSRKRHQWFLQCA
jgi:hypothetical protein